MQKVIVFGYSYTVGGVEHFLMNMTQALRERIEFLFAIENQNEITKNEYPYDDQVELLSNARLNPKQYIKDLRKILNNHKHEAKVVYLNVSDFKFESLAVLFLALCYRYRVVIHAHAARGEKINGISHRIIHRVILLFSRWLCMSKNTVRLAVSNRAGKYLYGNCKFKTISPGIKTKRFKFSQKERTEIRNKYNINESIVLGFVGRLVEVKNPLFVIDLVAAIKAYRSIKLLVVGDGPLRKKVEKYVKQKGIEDDVVFVGQINNVEDYYSAMDCLIGTSYSEGLPLTILEALASGLKCVVNKSGYPNELSKFNNVIFCDVSEDIQSWVAAINSIEILSSVKRENENERMIKSGYDEKTISNLIEKILKMKFADNI